MLPSLSIDRSGLASHPQRIKVRVPTFSREHPALVSDMASDPKREKIGDRPSSDRSEAEFTHMDHPGRASEATAVDKEEQKRLEASQKLENPLGGFTPEQLGRMGEEYCEKHGITDEADVRAFRLGAMIAGNMNKYDTMRELTAQERAVLDGETTHKWRNPKMLYAVVASKYNPFITRSFLASQQFVSRLLLSDLHLTQSALSVPLFRAWTRRSSTGLSLSIRSSLESGARLSGIPGYLVS